MKLLAIVSLLATVVPLQVLAETTCWHNSDCNERWVGYTCSCANARVKFINAMKSQGINCWTGPGFGVGCDNDCGGKCDCGRNHHWEAAAIISPVVVMDAPDTKQMWV
ncbi:hypothetical protein CIHG_03054 [Coccidioides immitis H538.4]|nr:hypothetical protein CIRG_00748 [Coccidioides immitis RMSCC 2394]KMU80758.1 hypothetical protein CISG_08701 [Coccidioides immitis RMSCC 3703]KMU85270.1 hypothetical protein CIHG_03054 [Coccidioides immitis H538.4]